MGELCSFTFKFRLSRRVKLGNGSALAGTSPSPPCSLVSQLFPLLEWKIPTPQRLQNQHSYLSTLLTPQNLHPSPSTSSDHSSHHLDGRWNSSSFSSVKSQNILSWNHRVQLLALPPASHLVLFQVSPTCIFSIEKSLYHAHRISLEFRGATGQELQDTALRRAWTETGTRLLSLLWMWERGWDTYLGEGMGWWTGSMRRQKNYVRDLPGGREGGGTCGMS